MPAKRFHHPIVRLILFTVVLLLYEATGNAIATSVPMVNVEISPSQNRDNKVLIMPVWARKAGGHWKPELLQQESKKAISQLADDKHEVGSENQGSVSQELTGYTYAPKLVTVENKRSADAEVQDNAYEYIYDEWEDEEPDCPDDMFYHIRGKKCVPVSCPGGNSWRDRDTGECTLKHYRNPYRWRYSRPWRPYHSRRTPFNRGGGRSWTFFGR